MKIMKNVSLKSPYIVCFVKMCPSILAKTKFVDDVFPAHE